MNMSFWNAAVGAQQQMLRMQVQGNNIANVNTSGYKAEVATFAELMFRDVEGIDGERLPKGTGTYMTKATTNYTTRAIMGSDRELDFAIEGNGFFGLYDPSDGEISFTRDGSFTTTQFFLPPDENAEPGPDGEDPEPTEVWRLSDGDGRFVLDAWGNFITVDPMEEGAYNLDNLNIGVFDFQIYDGKLHADDSRFIPIDKNGGVRVGSGTVRQGMLEMSNVDLGTELVKVIEAQRAYGVALKMVMTSDEIEQTINGLR